MAEREMSGKALLDKLYSGLDTMPAVDAEMDARDLRRLTDDFLGKPTQLTATGQHAATASRTASNVRPAEVGARKRGAPAVYGDESHLKTHPAHKLAVDELSLRRFEFWLQPASRESLPRDSAWLALERQRHASSCAETSHPPRGLS